MAHVWRRECCPSSEKVANLQDGLFVHVVALHWIPGLFSRMSFMALLTMTPIAMPADLIDNDMVGLAGIFA